MGSRTAVASGDRRKSGRVSKRDEETQTETKQDKRGRGCSETHTKMKGECGPICLPFGEATRGVFI